MDNSQAEHDLNTSPMYDPKTSNWTNLFGVILVFVLIALIFVMFWATGGNLLSGHWAAFFIGVGLVTGLSFWIITDATGEFYGKLGGMAITRCSSF